MHTALDWADRASSSTLSANLLILFDIDGTILLDDAHAHERAMVQATRSVYQVQLPDDAVERVEPWGKTDLQIVRDVLRLAGVNNDETDRRRSVWIDAAGCAFVAEAAALTASWRVRPGLAEALARLSSLGMRATVVTGNLRVIATVKVGRMGLAESLDIEIGAYADDAEDRVQLAPIARERAGSPGFPWPRARTVVVGDTPRDIAGARADGVRSVVFSSARYPAAALIGADIVITQVRELVATLESWQATETSS